MFTLRNARAHALHNITRLEYEKKNWKTWKRRPNTWSYVLTTHQCKWAKYCPAFLSPNAVRVREVVLAFGLRSSEKREEKIWMYKAKRVRRSLSSSSNYLESKRPSNKIISFERKNFGAETYYAPACLIIWAKSLEMRLWHFNRGNFHLFDVELFKYSVYIFQYFYVHDIIYILRLIANFFPLGNRSNDEVVRYVYKSL